MKETFYFVLMDHNDNEIFTTEGVKFIEVTSALPYMMQTSLFINPYEQDVYLKLFLRDGDITIGVIKIPVDVGQKYEEIENRFKLELVKRNYFKNDVVFGIKLVISEQDL
jgi:hypothetical protein